MPFLHNPIFRSNNSLPNLLQLQRVIYFQIKCDNVDEFYKSFKDRDYNRFNTVNTNHDVYIIKLYSAIKNTKWAEDIELEQELKKSGLKDRFKTMVGGAPVTQRWADRIGADAFAENAPDGVKKAKALLGIE